MAANREDRVRTAAADRADHFGFPRGDGLFGATLSAAAAVKPYLKAHPQGTLLTLKVIPRASRNEIGEALGAELKVKVTAPPVDFAANLAVVELIAATLNCPKSAVTLV